VNGTWALICPEAVATSGSGVLLSVTQLPPRMVGSGVDPAVALAARFCPRIETNPPGAIPVRRLAVFTTPPGLTLGVAERAAPVSGITLSPVAVSM
jgi:hypothetical protein